MSIKSSLWVLFIFTCSSLLLVSCDHQQYARACVNTGLHYVLNDRNDRAEKWYKKAIEHDPENLDAYQGLAFVYTQDGRYKEMEKVCNQALDVAPANITAQVCIGKAKFFQGDMSGAEKICKEYRTIDARECVARIHFAQNDFAEAASLFTTLYEDQLAVEQMEEEEPVSLVSGPPLSVLYFARAAYAKMKAGDNAGWCTDVRKMCGEMNWCYAYGVASNTGTVIAVDEIANEKVLKECR